jgi:hypothetical protein
VEPWAESRLPICCPATFPCWPSVITLYVISCAHSKGASEGGMCDASNEPAAERMRNVKGSIALIWLTHGTYSNTELA